MSSRSAPFFTGRPRLSPGFAEEIFKLVVRNFMLFFTDSTLNKKPASALRVNPAPLFSEETVIVVSKYWFPFGFVLGLMVTVPI